MEHSRLLKFFKPQPSIPDMAETPTFKVQIDYQKPENVEAEVPESQEKREVDANAVTEVTDEFTLSPVITVTKKEATFTKGDLKLQKVTVTEDIAMEEIQDGGQSRVTRTYQTLQRDGKTITRTTSTTESSHGSAAIEDKHQEVKKSKIPLLNFKQTVEKVQKEKKSRKKQDDEVAKRPRKSSIPKLSKDTKIALKKSEPSPALAPEDEFEKIYEQVADKQTDYKVLSVKIEDPEKVERKFEELIHSYEDDDNTSVLQVEKLRQSKIPALRRRKGDGDASKMNAIVNTIRLQNAVRNSREFPIEDEFGEVISKTITTKRFSRGNSQEATIETDDDSKDVKTITKLEIMVRGNSKIAKPVHSTVTRTEKVTKLNTNDNHQDVTMTVDIDNADNNNNNERIIKTTRIIQQSSRIATPVVTTVTRTEKLTKMDTNDVGNREATMTVEVLDDPNDNNKEVIKTQRIVKQITGPATPGVTTVTRTEKVTQIDTSNDSNTDIDKRVTNQKIVTKRTVVPEATEVTNIEKVVDITNTDQGTAKNIARERITKEINKLNPVITKVSTSVTDPNAYDNQRSMQTEYITESIVERQGFVSQDRVEKEISKIHTIARDTDLNHDEINNKNATLNVTKTQTVTKSTVGPVSFKDKSIKVITTQTSLNSDETELIKTDTSKEAIEINTADEINTENKNTETNITQSVTKGVMVTEQIVKEGIKIGIPVFTKATGETSTAIDNNIIDDKNGEAETDREKDRVTITQVTRTWNQDNIQNVGDDDNTVHINRANDIKYNKFNTKTTEQGSIKKLHTINTCVTETITKTKSELTENITDKELTNEKDAKDTNIDYTNQRVIQDTNTQLRDKNTNVEEITVLKGNVSRLINRLGSRENREINEVDISNDGTEKDIVYQERIRRLDKMISEFNKVDFKSANATEYAKEILSKNENEDSVVNAQDKDGEDITILRGNVSRLINKLGVKDTENIQNRGITISLLNQNEENIKKFDDKSNQNETEHESLNVKHINCDGAVTVIKKETVDTINITNVTEIKNENDNINEKDTNIYNMKDILYTRPVGLEKDVNTELKLVSAITEKEIVATGSIAKEKDSKPDDIIKGSVNRLITKISTQGTNKPEAVIKEFQDELPKKKSVLSKVAIFERLEPIEYYPKPRLPRSENKTSKLVVKEISVSEKPRIVDEVLKDNAKVNPNDVDNKDVIGMTSFNETTVKAEPIIVDEIWKTSFNTDGKVHNVSATQTQEIVNFKTYDNKVGISKTEDTNAAIDLKTSTENIRSNIYFITDKDNVQNEATDATTENSTQIYDRVKHKYNIYEQNAITISQELNRSESREYNLKTNSYTIENGAATAEVKETFRFQYPVVETGDSKQFIIENDVKTAEYLVDQYKLKSKEDYKRTKSLAESDLGDAVKGKVNRLVGRLKSVDFERESDSTIKTEKINVKERPWKSSVLEKIALFEGKVAAAKVEIATEVPAKIAANLVITEEMYQEKITQLEAAKSLYQPVEVPTVTLGNGVEMPVIALGTALLDSRLIYHIVCAAIDLGYRAIDTAYIYGNEKAVGQAIKAKIDDGTVKREELFIMSKLWSTFHRGDLVEEACRATLANLGLTYIDLFMIHNPMSFKEGGAPIPKIATVLQYSQHDYLDAWFAMEKLVSQGLVRSIGVSNFNSSQIQRILDKGRVKPVVNQVECHPYLSQERLHEFCADRNITLSCFGVLGSKGTPAEYKSSLAPVIDDPLVQVMAQGLNITTAQLLIRYQIQGGHQAVVKSSSATHLSDNLGALNFTLSEPEMKALHALNKNKRLFTFLGMGETHKHYPFTAPF